MLLKSEEPFLLHDIHIVFEKTSIIHATHKAAKKTPQQQRQRNKKRQNS